MKLRLATLWCCGVLVVLAMLPAHADQNRGRARSAAADALAARDGSIFRWDGQAWSQAPGRGVRISVGPDGQPWVVNAQGNIYRRVNDTFEQVPGRGRDIAVGGDGSVWVIGDGNNIYRFNGRDFDRVDSGTPAAMNAVAIGVERFGVPWVVDTAGNIHYLRNNRFVRQAGTARDIGAGTGVWVIGSDNALYRLDGEDWARLGGSAVRVAAGAPNTAYVVNDTGGIYKWENNAFQQIPGWASDVAANARGDLWVIGEPERMGRGLLRRR